MFSYEAKVMQSDGDGEWFVRLHRRANGDPSDGGDFVGVCGANGPHEAEMVAACINAVIARENAEYPPEDALLLVRRMFDAHHVPTEDQIDAAWDSRIANEL